MPRQSNYIPRPWLKAQRKQKCKENETLLAVWAGCHCCCLPFLTFVDKSEKGGQLSITEPCSKPKMWQLVSCYWLRLWNYKQKGVLGQCAASLLAAQGFLHFPPAKLYCFLRLFSSFTSLCMPKPTRCLCGWPELCCHISSAKQLEQGTADVQMFLHVRAFLVECFSPVSRSFLKDVLSFCDLQ